MRKLIFLYLLGGPILLWGQAVITDVPVHFGQFFNNAQINPAKLGIDGSFELSFGSKRNHGGFAGINTSYFVTSYRLPAKKESFNTIGLNVSTDREGVFLSRNRAYVAYTRHQKLSDKWFFSGGFYIGLYSFGIKGNLSTEGASDASFDGSAGICVYSDNTRIGLTVNQFNAATLQPIDQVVSLNRHYYMMFEKDISVSDNFILSPALFSRIIDRNENKYLLGYSGGLSLNLTLNQLLRFGSSYEVQEGFYVFAGLNNINLSRGEGSSKNGQLNIDIAYFAPSIKNERTNIQSLELIVKYFIRKK